MASEGSGKPGVPAASSETFFAQLRRLAGEVEHGVKSAHQALESRAANNADGRDKAQAKNSLLHTKKEMSDLRAKMGADTREFLSRQVDMNLIVYMMESFLTFQAERLENVQAYMEKYGYVRPSFDTTRNMAASAEEEENDDDDASDDESDSAETVVEAESESQGESLAATPPRETTGEKPPAQHFMCTPKLEDLYKNLSEETIMIFKQGSRSNYHTEKTSGYVSSQSVTDHAGSTMAHTSVAAPQTPTLLTPGFKLKGLSQMPKLAPTNFISDAVPTTPELPTLLTQEITLKDFSRPVAYSVTSASKVSETGVIKTPEEPTLLTPGLKLSNAAIASEMKEKKEDALLQTPESPKLLTPGLKLNNFPDNAEEKRGGKSARSLFNTPPLPQLQTCDLSDYKFSSHTLSSMNKENEPAASRQTNLMSTPEPPKLLTAGLDLESFLYSRTNNNKK